LKDIWAKNKKKFIEKALKNPILTFDLKRRVFEEILVIRSDTQKQEGK